MNTSRFGCIASRSRQRRWRVFVRDVLVIVVVAVLVSVLVKTFLVRPFFVPSSSMENTLMVGDRILVNELVPHVIPVQRGDVVVFSDPGAWLSHSSEAGYKSALSWALVAVGLEPASSADYLVKRVIGLPGDDVECCDSRGKLLVNGAAIEEPYAVIRPGDLTSLTPFRVTVPADSLWVMGDNRGDSADSRFHMNDTTHGFVPFESVVGRAFVVNWPLDHWAWLDNYPAQFQDAGKKESAH